VALVQLLFPEGQRIAPGDKYGWQTFPLAQINELLASEGLIIHASRPSGVSQAITCTDADGNTERYGFFELRRRIDRSAAT
jgi:hypothetical protein